jgi:hypothetical protein
MEEYASLRGFPVIKAKALYLDIVKSFPSYGAAHFTVTYDGFWSFGDTITLMVSTLGVDFVQALSKEVVMSYTYYYITNFTAENDALALEVAKGDNGANDDNSEIYSFKSPAAEEIVSLMREYAPPQTHRVLLNI